MECVECESKTATPYNDPRSPPLETEPCLCADCYKMAIEDLIDGYEQEINYLKAALAQLSP